MEQQEAFVMHNSMQAHVAIHNFISLRIVVDKPSNVFLSIFVVNYFGKKHMLPSSKLAHIYGGARL